MKALKLFLPLVIGLIATAVSAQTISSYQAMVLSQSPSNYFKLDGSLVSAINGSVVLEPFAGGYASDVYRTSSNCWFFVDQNTAYLRNLSDHVISGGGS